VGKPRMLQSSGFTQRRHGLAGMTSRPRRALRASFIERPALEE